MASKYWLKLYHETVFDPKVMMMSPGARLRWYECLCLAGDYNKDGELPPINHMVFVFRISQEQLLAELNELIESGMVVKNSNAFIVKNWIKRQEASGTTERVKRYRDTKQKQEYYEGVTIRYTNCNESETNRCTDIDIDKEVDKDKEIDVDEDVNCGDGGELSTEFKSLFPGLKPKTAEDQKNWDDAYSRMLDSGVTPDIMRKTVSEMSDKNYKITNPGSLITPCIITLARDRPRAPDSTGKYAEFIQH